MKSIKNFSTLPKSILSCRTSKLRCPTAKDAPRRAFIGMSGGVDSSVSALLLKKAGYDVTGVFIKTWSPEWLAQLRRGSAGQACNWREERRDAIRVAAHIGIPLITLDLEKEYKREVADYMIAEYRVGRTPNPDVMCNKKVKFGAFYDWAIKTGADIVATGHYAQIQEAKLPLGSLASKLLMGKDLNKDQSYFLWTIKQEQLAHILFPIGHLKKDEVREIARENNLPVAEKKDSQGVCFLGVVDMKEFLKHYIKTEPGNVLNESGQTIGTHDGAVLYTLGERHGFTILARSLPAVVPPLGGGTAKERLFVISKDIRQNTITVSKHRPVEVFAKKEFELKDVNWLAGEYPNPAKSYLARVRYRQDLQKIKLISLDDRTAKLEFEHAQAVDAGQSVVIYDGKVCLGGGVVK